MRNKIIAISIIGLFLLTGLTQVTAITVEKGVTADEKENIQILDDPETINIGHMSIIDGTCNIELVDEILIDGESIYNLDKVYQFFITYEFEEGLLSLGEDFWSFGIHLYDCSVIRGEDSKDFGDNPGATDSGSGELYVSAKLEGIWFAESINDRAIIRVECCHMIDPLWGVGGSEPYINCAKQKSIKIKTTLPDDHIKIFPVDGTDFGTVKPRRSLEKQFYVESRTLLWVNGDWIIEGDGFSIVDFEHFSLNFLKRDTITVKFSPNKEGEYSAKLKAPCESDIDGINYYDEIVLTARCSRARIKVSNNIQILMDRFPLFERLLNGFF